MISLLQKVCFHFSRKFKDIKELRGGVLVYTAQAIPPPEAEIVEKDHLWSENSLINKGGKIRKDAIVCPGSIVTASVPGESMVSGNPARITRAAKGCEAEI